MKNLILIGALALASSGAAAQQCTPSSLTYPQCLSAIIANGVRQGLSDPEADAINKARQLDRQYGQPKFQIPIPDNQPFGTLKDPFKHK